MSKQSLSNKAGAPFEDARIKRSPSNADDEPVWPYTAPIFDPRDLGPLFGKSARLPGDDESVYDELLSKVTVALAPRDIVEAIFVKEFVDRIWDSQFYQRVRIGFLTGAQKEAIKRFAELDDQTFAQWAAGDKIVAAAIETVLKDQGLDWETIRGQALSNKLDRIEQLDSLIERADSRRDKALQNLERRRESGRKPYPPVIEGTRTDGPQRV